MNVIVPLAGQDYFEKGFAKGLIETEKGPLLLSTLKSRAWFKDIAPNDYHFILLDHDNSRTFFNSHLNVWFPGCRAIFISHLAKGAAMSVLAGLSLISFNTPIIIDLADIYFDSLHIPFQGKDPIEYGGIGYSFESESNDYSYFLIANDGTVEKAVEKLVISNHASAGVYGFKSSSILLKAISHSIENSELQMHNNLHYVCPLLNGVISQGLKVITKDVSNVLDIKQMYLK